jgi:glycerate 2-kinase
MRIVIAPDKFKGALSGAQAAGAMGRGVLRVFPHAEVVSCPLADGGEGTVTALVEATGGRLVRKSVCGPRPGMKVEAEFGLLGDGETAVIEMAAASGLALLPVEQRNPLETTTFGTGELILGARESGAKRIILGIGGSATTDGGIGALQALGARFSLSDSSGSRLAEAPLVGADLALIDRAFPPTDPDLPELLIACDVTNPLYGPQGAAAIFGPQKGATPEQVRFLDDALQRFARITGTNEVAQRPGSGAAGGLGYGLSALIPGTRMAPGFALVAEALGFQQKLQNADWCLTAEGRLDRSSLSGKTAVGVARMCQGSGVRCAILAGSVEAEAEEAVAGLGAVAFSIVDGAIPLDEAMRRTSELLERAAARVMRVLQQSGQAL